MAAPLIALILLLGFYPKPLLGVIEPAVQDDPEPRRASPTRVPCRCGRGEPSEHPSLPPDDRVRLQLAPVLIVFAAACLGVLVEAFVPRRWRFVSQIALVRGRRAGRLRRSS